MSENAARIALITGAGRNVGRALALAFADAGYDVALAARSVDELERVADEIRAKGRRALTVPFDVTDPAAIAAGVGRIHERLGRLDVLVNNAGGATLGPFQELSPEAFRRDLDVNLFGAAMVMQAVLPDMVKRRFGRIVNVASLAGKKGMPGLSAYSAAKAGLIGLTRAVAQEVAAHGVTVNAVCPGLLQEGMGEELIAWRAKVTGKDRDATIEAAKSLMPQGTVMTSEELAPAVLFLASDGAGRITGEAMNVSGGVFMW